MTFPAKLERLLKEATEGPWYLLGQPWLPSDCKTAMLSGSPDPHVAKFVCDFDMMADDNEQPDKSWEDAELICFLRNHADAILGLVRAAEATEKALKVLSRSYAPEFCEHDRVAEAKRIIENHGGTLAYLADHIKLLADSRAKLNGEEK